LTHERPRLMRLPNADECVRLLKSQGCEEHVVRHSIAVSALAMRIARRCGADPDLVLAGSLLHDIGRCRTHGIRHAVVGAEIVRAEGFPESLATIVERHIGAGLSAAEAASLGLPERDFMPLTLEEKVVAHADNLTSGESRRRVAEALSDLARRGLEGPAVKVMRLHKELSSLCGTDVDDIG
jgi:tRNA (cytidine56-2'-O)-methyltransferase